MFRQALLRFIQISNESSCSVKNSLRFYSRVSVKNVCNKWTRTFIEKEISEPDTSAELITAHVLGKKMIHEVQDNYEMSKSEVEVVDGMCQQRLQSIPVPYIIGEWDFHDLTLKMRKPVLIPRPETEELAGFVCDHIRTSNLRNGRILDIGCGSGAIGLHILNTFKQIHGVAVDKDKEAHKLTIENSLLHGVQDRLQVLHIDIFSQDAVSKLQDYLPFDVVVSNPPYIPTKNIEGLQREVRSYESRDALDGGKDGLDVIRQIIHLAPKLLNSGGQLWLEVDLGEPDQIKDLLIQNTLVSYVKTLLDFTKRDRYCVLQVTS